MVCGFGEAVSYSMLVKRLLNRNLDKTSRFTDWSRRPLSERQLTYALGDVTHLRDLYPKLRAQLDKSERASWLNEEMAVLTDPATYELHPEAGVAAAQDAHQDAEGARRADGACRLARARGAEPGRAARPHPEGRGALRHRQPSAAHGRGSRLVAHAA